jgi:hypothetical protein
MISELFLGPVNIVKCLQKKLTKGLQIVLWLKYTDDNK